jgi:hypothetical protein
MPRERAESEWTDEHPEYDIEREPFPSRVGEMAQPIYMWDVDVTFEQLETEAPHRAYVVDCYSRTSRLVKVLRSLSTVEKLLALDAFPVVTPAGKIHREEWFRAALDICLARVTAVRDCLFLLIATVFEVDLLDRDVTLKKLRKNIGRQDLIALLDGIAATARETRDERDRKFHRGVERDFDELGLYHSISILEMYGSANTTVESHPPGGGPTWDLKTVHADAVATVRTELRAAASALIELTLDLFDILIDEYDTRWAARRDRARSVRDWERP